MWSAENPTASTYLVRISEVAQQHLLHEALRRPQLQGATAAVPHSLNQAGRHTVLADQLLDSRLIATSQPCEGIYYSFLLREVCRSQELLQNANSKYGCHVVS